MSLRDQKEFLSNIHPFELLSDKEQMILVYCRSGRRATDASIKLAKMGYVNVYNFGGIVNWPYEIVK